MLDTKLFREAMARVGAAVNVVTTDGPAGRGGITATAMCSVTDQPPTLLVCINRSGTQHDMFKTNGVMCVNTLSHEHRELSGIFAGLTGAASSQRFESGHWTALTTGAPVLDDAAVTFDCRITQFVEVGTHSVIFAQVEAIRLAESASSLIYFGRAYHPLLPAKA